MSRSIRGFLICGLVAVGLVLTGSSAQAGTTVIDFESFGDVVPVTSVVVPGNVVTFSIIHPTGGTTPAYTAKVGGSTTAFVPNDMPFGMQSGTFLTDERAGPNLTGDYRMQFANPISSLSLDLYDYRVDGGPGIGDRAILTVYSDSNWTSPIGSDIFTIPSPNPVDGNIEHLSVTLGSYNILSADLTFVDGPLDANLSGTDVGTGIDNIAINTIPAPGAILLGALGTGIVGVFRRRKSL